MVSADSAGADLPEVALVTDLKRRAAGRASAHFLGCVILKQCLAGPYAAIAGGATGVVTFGELDGGGSVGRLRGSVALLLERARHDGATREDTTGKRK